MTPTDIQAILQQLLQAGHVTPEAVTAAQTSARQTGKTVLDELVATNQLDSEALVQASAAVLGVPAVKLTDQEIDPDILATISQDIAENYRVVPWKREDNTVAVAMEDPHDYLAVEALDFIARRDNIRFQYTIASSDTIDTILRQYEDLSTEVGEALEAQVAAAGGEEAAPSTDEDVKSAPISKSVAVILRYAVEGAASDVHIEPTENGTRVRYRMDGVLHTSLHLPENVHDALVARIKVLSNLKLDETRLPQDGRFRMNIEGRDVDFRVSTLPLLDKEKVVLRILDRKSGLMSLDKLGYVDHAAQLIAEHIQTPHGMVLVTGPTGSGKSTTLYSLLSDVNNDERNIVTLEDPVEYNLPGISQSQVRPEIGLTFAQGLRSVLRQDPDVIMVGEIRDTETAELAVHAALTGHMLLSTLHTNDAIGAVPRLIDMSIEPFLIASSLNLIVAQRLVRKLCQDCKQPAQLSPELLQEVQEELSRIPKQSVPQDIAALPTIVGYTASGCAKCDETGYDGRMAIAEAVEMTDEIRNLITTGKVYQTNLIDRALLNQGMVSLRQDGVIKALRGLTTFDNVWTATDET